jgi:hypothetical protein
MTLTSVANIDSVENTPYRTTINKLYPQLFLVNFVEDEDFYQIIKQNLKLLTKKHTKISELSYFNENVKSTVQSSIALKKYKGLLKLEAFVVFCKLYLYKRKQFENGKYTKFLFTFADKCDEFTKYSKNLDLTTYTDQEKKRLLYLIGKMRVSSIFSKKYLKTLKNEDLDW